MGGHSTVHLIYLCSHPKASALIPVLPVLDQDRFAKEILGNFYKTENVQSFVRQLNMCVGVSLGGRFRLACTSHGRLALQRLATSHLALVARCIHKPALSSAYGELEAHRQSVVFASPCCHPLCDTVRRGLELPLAPTNSRFISKAGGALRVTAGPVLAFYFARRSRTDYVSGMGSTRYSTSDRVL